MTTSSTRAAGHEGTHAPHSPADEVRHTNRKVYRSILRLQKAEAARRSLNHDDHPRQLDDMFEAISKMDHRRRLDRLAELGKRTDDLEFPEPPR